jgi:hypothetical protein
LKKLKLKLERKERLLKKENPKLLSILKNIENTFSDNMFKDIWIFLKKTRKKDINLNSKNGMNVYKRIRLQILRLSTRKFMLKLEKMLKRLSQQRKKLQLEKLFQKRKIKLLSSKTQKIENGLDTKNYQDRKEITE